MIPTVEIVKVFERRVWKERRFSGDLVIRMQHEGEAEPFDFVTLAYDYRYTSNGHQHQIADAILEMLSPTAQQGVEPNEP